MTTNPDTEPGAGRAVADYVARLLDTLSEDQLVALDALRIARRDQDNAYGAWTIVQHDSARWEQAYRELQHYRTAYNDAYSSVTGLDTPSGAINHYNDLGARDSRYVLDAAAVEIIRDRATGTVLNHPPRDRILAIVRTAAELGRHEGISVEQLHTEIEHGATRHQETSRDHAGPSHAPAPERAPRIDPTEVSYRDDEGWSW